MQDDIISHTYGSYPHSCEENLYFIFGILTYCFAEAFGWEPSFSTVQFRFACFIASIYVFCFPKNIKPSKNLMAFPSLSNYLKTYQVVFIPVFC